MPDQIDDIPIDDDANLENIPLEELRIYLDDELIFDGSQPSTYIASLVASWCASGEIATSCDLGPA